MTTLQKGSRGEEVTQLQQMLKDAGFFPKEQQTTKFFGDITERALKAYQQSKGMNSDGIFNPSTKQNLTSAPETNAFYEQLVKAGNFQGAAQYKQLMDSGSPDALVIAKGFTAPTGLTPEAIQGFRDIAASETDKYYKDFAGKYKGDTDSFLQSALGGYESDVSGMQTKLGSDVNTMNDTEGQRGTWASSGRQDRLNSLQNTYNTSFKDLYNKTLSQTQDKLRGAEYDVGYTPPAQLGLTQTNVSQTQAPQFQSTSSNIYNPFGFAGRMQAEQKTANNVQGNNLAQAQMYNPFKY